MLNFVPMREVNMMVLKEDIDKVTDSLVKLGLIQLLDIKEVSQDLFLLHKEPTAAEREKCAELKRRIEGLAERLEIRLLPPQGKALRDIDMAQIEKKVVFWEEKSGPLLLEKERIERLKKEKEEIYTEIKMLPDWEMNLARRYSYIYISLYEIKARYWENFQREISSLIHLLVPYFQDGGIVRFVLVIMKKDQEFLDTLVNKYALNRIKTPPKDTSLLKQEIESEIRHLEEKLRQEQEKIEAWRREIEVEMRAVFFSVKKWQAFWQAREYFSHSDYVYFISGWVAEKKERILRVALERICGQRLFYESLPASDISLVKKGCLRVPVLFSHPFFLSPFENLVKIYGVPAYGMIDPTLIVAVLFVLMFGAMFGDLGQGIVLLLAGLLLRRQKKEIIKKSGVIISLAGMAAAVFGLFYGSFFGFENVLPAFWLRPLKNISYLFKLTVAFGVLVISGGIIINIINNLRFRDYRRLFFDKAGLISGVIYWASLGVVVRFIAGLRDPFFDACGIILFLSLMIFLGERFLIQKGGEEEKEKKSALAYIFEKLMEIFEIFLGYLTNTLSFIRIAAFSLAHIGLFVAIFSLADIIRKASGNSWGSGLVIVFGNIFIIFLEGLVVTIQVLRLEYYEFFSRFFNRQGEEFKPLRVEES